MARNYKNNHEGPSAEDKAVERFNEMMIERLKSMKASDWKKGWVSGTGHHHGLPQNLGGRVYNGTNSFFLQMDSAMHGYKMPVYMTFNDVKRTGAHVLAHAESMPIIYWNLSIKDEHGHKVDKADFDKMSSAEQQKCSVHPFLKAYNVFNLDQTNFKEVQAEKYNQIEARFQGIQLKDTAGMYKNEALDKMLSDQTWICPIQYDNISSNAYYSPREDKIVLPTKAQFNISKTKEGVYKDGMEFYSSLLHEATHSTNKVLHRDVGRKFGDAKYAKEELVAELSAAMVGDALGFDKRILDNNAAYVDSWLDALNKEPQFIVSVMSEVGKASNLIMQKVDEQLMSLGQEPLLDTNRKVTKETAEAVFKELKPVDHSVIYNKQDNGEGKEQTSEQKALVFQNASVFKDQDGNYKMRGSYQGVALESKPLSKEERNGFFKNKGYEAKGAFLQELMSKRYAAEIQEIGQQKSVSKKIG